MNLKDQTLEILEKHGLSAKKSLGQNFLISESHLAKIIEAAELMPDDFVFEIGPGLGTMTRELTKKCPVKAIEMDESLKSILKDLPVEFGDALEFDMSSLPKGYKVVANIPYYITSPLIRHILHNENKPRIIVLLTQKEVAEKVANPNKNSVIALNVKTFGTPEIVDIVPASAFMPPPKVDSAILKITVHDVPSVSCDLKKYFWVIKMSFSRPRKKLRNNLKSLVKDLENCPIDLEKRAEDLSIQEFEDLTNFIIKQS